MRIHLGWFTFLLSFASAACLVATLLLSASYEVPTGKAVLGFFGFGILAVASGGATAMLWNGFTSHQKVLGWTATMVSIVCGVGVVLGVATIVLSQPTDPVGQLIVRLIGLGVTASACGGFGIAMLYAAEGKNFPE